MRISDWSSDVCSSDLFGPGGPVPPARGDGSGEPGDRPRSAGGVDAAGGFRSLEKPMMAASPRMRNALTLFSSVDDVLCHRVRLVLAAKGVTYDLIPVDPQKPPEDLIDLNPYHSVPTLVEQNGRASCRESVCQYV